MSNDAEGGGGDGGGGDPTGGGGSGGPDGERKRRRRRRGRGEPADASAAGPAAPSAATPAATGEPGARPVRAYRGGGGGGPAAVPASPAAGDGEPASVAPPAPPAAGEAPRRERQRRERRPEQRTGQPGGPPTEPRAGQPAEQRPRPPREDRPPREPREPRPPRERRSEPASAGGAPAAAPAPSAPAPARLAPPRRAPVDSDELDAPPEPASIAWGTDDPGPAPTIALAPDLPLEPADDLEPLTAGLVDAPQPGLGDDIASVAGVRFVASGRISWFDAGDAEYAAGDRVVVDAERGTRLGWVAAPPVRRAIRDRGLRRIIRRAGEHDLRGEREGEADRARALRLAKDLAAGLALPLKVFRVEGGGGGRSGKLNVYYTSDERLDLRELVRQLGTQLGARIELRQLGVRDEAKAVGGIGSCGLTLCCTTWLPDFVPVSIKMAKDQGLVLSPTKVSGQCGRLKCCLVYEQAGYAELRKGLPKLGKRVTSARGEGRVVEVDVLRQRVRVSYAPGDTEVLPAAEVTPLFPSGNQPGAPRAPGAPGAPGTPDTDDSDDSSDDATDPSTP